MTPNMPLPPGAVDQVTAAFIRELLRKATESAARTGAAAELPNAEAPAARGE